MTAPTPRTIAALDGLRGLACLLVVFFHAGLSGLYWIESMGLLGVALFFSLSGFLMAYHYLPGEVSLRYWFAFLLRRVLRVYPAFAVTVLLCWLVAEVTQHYYFTSRFAPSHVLGHLLLQQGTYVLWTVVVEIKFYFIFPLLAGAVWLMTKYRCPALLCMALLWLLLLVISLPQDRLSLWPFLSFFVGGIVAAMLHARDDLQKYIPASAWVPLAMACLAVIAVSIVPKLAAYIATPTKYWDFWHTPWYSPLTALTVLSVARCDGLIARVFSSRPARFVGEISYSLYLIHAFVFVFIHVVVNPFPESPVLEFFFKFVAAFIGALILYRLVEVPFHRLGRRLSAKMMVSR